MAYQYQSGIKDLGYTPGQGFNSMGANVPIQPKPVTQPVQNQPSTLDNVMKGFSIAGNQKPGAVKKIIVKDPNGGSVELQLPRRDNNGQGLTPEAMAAGDARTKQCCRSR